MTVIPLTTNKEIPAALVNMAGYFSSQWCFQCKFIGRSPGLVRSLEYGVRDTNVAFISRPKVEVSRDKACSVQYSTCYPSRFQLVDSVSSNRAATDTNAHCVGCRLQHTRCYLCISWSRNEYASRLSSLSLNDKATLSCCSNRYPEPVVAPSPSNAVHMPMCCKFHGRCDRGESRRISYFAQALQNRTKDQLERLTRSRVRSY